MEHPTSSDVANRIFGVPCGERNLVASQTIACSKCGIATPGFFWATATAEFKLIGGVMRRLFLWDGRPCECQSDGIWLSDGPALP